MTGTDLKSNRKRITDICLILFLMLLFANCGERELICGESRNKGIIVRDADLNHWCISELHDQSFIIDDQDALDSLYLAQGCEEGEINASIDFSQYTLLGVYMGGGGCDATFIREVEEDPEREKYTYTVKMKECGLCDMYIYSMNWVQVPKLPEGWYVEFITSHV